MVSVMRIRIVERIVTITYNLRKTGDILWGYRITGIFSNT